MNLLLAILSGFILAACAPWLHRVAGPRTGWLLALLPLGLMIYFASLAGTVAAGQAIAVAYPWIPSLGLELSFYLDGLALLMALLISGIGALVIIYASGYLKGHAELGRFYALILLFMAAMLGTVLANNLLLLFVFWELTSLSSYLLIGFEHEDDKARSAALQALLVTAGGGLALLAGFVLIGQSGAGFQVTDLLKQGDVLRANPLYLPILLLILLGAFTKSAQFPFYFWLPNAMQAPTPVSAYLHSATMVKAGIYLLARLHPALGGTDAWFLLLTLAGAATMLLGAFVAIHESDLKRILAYSTIAALGLLTFLLASREPVAVEAAILFLFAHALYKGGLFLVTGAIDHASGTRDVTQLGGLFRAMPLTGSAAVLGALSMAGIPPMFGFISKELSYEAVTGSSAWGPLGIGVMFLTSVMFVAIAGVVGFTPFFTRAKQTPKQPHEAPVSLWLGPGILAAAALALAVWPDPLAKSVLGPAAAAVLGHDVTLHLALWHGFTPVLALSALTIAGGAVLFAARPVLQHITSRLAPLDRVSPGNLYEWGLENLMEFAGWVTAVLQNGFLRFYLTAIIATTILLVSYPLLARASVLIDLTVQPPLDYGAILALLILFATGAALRTTSRLGAIAALGIVGYSVALLFLLYGAPDLAMTQFLFETLAVILFVLVFYHLPRFTRLTPLLPRMRDVAISISIGALMTALVLITTHVKHLPSISDYFIEHSYELGHGRNIVNVILVDFRALDTLGEITVLSAAAVGVFAMLRLRLGPLDERPRRRPR